MHRIYNLCGGVHIHVMITALVIAFYILSLLSENLSSPVVKTFMFELELKDYKLIYELRTFNPKQRCKCKYWLLV